MSTFRSVFGWLLKGSLLVLLVLVGLIAVARFIYPTAAQREAIAELERWPSYEGKNAAALLWSLHYDVPMADLDRVWASDLARQEQLQQAFDEGLAPASDPSAFAWVSARESYGSLAPNLEHAPKPCGSYQTGCLARVRDDLPAYGAGVASAAALLERMEALQGYDFIRDPVRSWAWQPDGSLRVGFRGLLNWDIPFSWLRTRYALQFAQGQTTAALAGLCRNLLTWRRLGAQADTLIWQMGFLGTSEGDSMLLAEMLAELPTDKPLPAPCDEALLPPAADEQSLCNSVRDEFAYAMLWEDHYARQTARQGNSFDKFLSEKEL
ncbi:MAG: hypothetical protein HRU51_08410, partial [Xanthomonadales bacterium]|nr:hypothetical protein [Xanthomonadales bacterium]